MKTHYFSNTFGVFEGGGVRAAAFAGAYAEAIALGVKFNAVAGTSAGSIVAALIAAGATPEFLLEELAQTSFRDLLDAPREVDRPFNRAKWLASLGGAIPGAIGSVATIVKNGGLHSSAKIEHWIEGLLRRVLTLRGVTPAGDRVTFADLTLPIFIVSADLAAGRPKIWSKSATRDESVAVAVRCSSSIPFFFQPVRSGGALHVDGGIISNLPSYVFAEAQPSAARFSERVLAFRLRSAKNDSAGFREFSAFAGSVADAVVSGGTAVQLKLQSNVHSVEIDTGTIKSTDFDKLDAEAQMKLVESGRSAMRSFVANEQLTMSAVTESRTYEGYDERMLAYVHMLQRGSRSALFVDRSSYFLFMIFPALLASARRGLVLRYFCDPTADAEEIKRRTTLRRLGFDVIELSELPFTGLFTDADHEFAVSAVSSVEGRVGIDFPYEVGETRLYTTATDAGVMSVLRRATGHDSLAAKVRDTSIRLQTVPTEHLFDLLRRVPQYEKATFELIDLQLDDKLQSMQAEVKEFKLLQIADLAEQFRSEGVALFAPMFAILRDGSESLITPPVVEEVGESLVLIEGHSRAYYCMRLGVPSMKAVRVRGASE
ncbi:patatin-like phospholipase family protein [Sphingobium sp. B2]|uniref:patatin-like phospholipase family protein n=1 Tax=Sphingobium sp. B2 TaxID=2583228 RepID=UPI0016436E95|nr:patatin-like phospholipase family protein [Sphingobium sp. B2]